MPRTTALSSHGGDHGGLGFVRPRVGWSGRIAILHDQQGNLSQRYYHLAERCGTFQALDCCRPRLQRGYGRPRPQGLSPARTDRTHAWQVHGTQVARYARIPDRFGSGSANFAVGVGLWLQRLVAGPAQPASPAAHGHRLQRRSTRPHRASAEVFVPAPQAHAAGQARRGGLRAGGGQATDAQKKPSPTRPTRC